MSGIYMEANTVNVKSFERKEERSGTERSTEGTNFSLETSFLYFVNDNFKTFL
jgi:hypothetical protein